MSHHKTVLHSGMRRISVPLYAPILVMVIVVALVNVGGVALSAGSDNRPRNAPTPVLVATRFIPAGTPLSLFSAPWPRPRCREERPASLVCP